MENDFEAILGTFCGYDHGNKASHTVQKIAVGRKCIVNTPGVLKFVEKPKHTYQSITVKNGWLQQYLPRS